MSKASKLNLQKPESDLSVGDMLLYQAAGGEVRVECLFRDENLWLTQKALADLFGVKRPAVTKHLGNIFATGELVEDSVCSILEPTAVERAGLTR